MEQKHVCASICDGLPTLSTNHPWLVDQNLEDHNGNIRNHIIYTTRDPPFQSRFRIPSLLGRRIWGCFYGWVILSNHPHNDLWSLWNPVASKIIYLPRLAPKNGFKGSSFTEFCLSSPPNDHGSIFMLATINYTIIFCRLDCKRKKLKWVEMSYAKQMRSIVGCDSFLCELTCCNRRVYALSSGYHDKKVIHIDIVVKGRQTVISLMPYLEPPPYTVFIFPDYSFFLKGCCTELFFIEVSYNEMTRETIGDVRVFKLGVTDIKWDEMEDLKDAAFFVDLDHNYSVFYSPASEVGGCVHFLDTSGKVIHSIYLKNRTTTLSLMSEHRLHREIKSLQENEMAETDDKVVDSNSMMIETHEESMESLALNIPFDVLEKIMEFCVGVEYLNFRATCKQWHLAAPMIRWSKGQGGRLQSYSLASPWLMVVHENRGVISFTDPICGDIYYIKTPQQLLGRLEIHCSYGGWLLIRRVEGPLMFFNPFTGDIRELPFVPYLDSYCFSTPPTSPDCKVVGFTTFLEWKVYIHFVAIEPYWFRFHLNNFFGDDSQPFRFATYCGPDIYVLYTNERVGFICGDDEDYTWYNIPRNPCIPPKQNFVMKCDQHLLLVMVGVFGESIEVFKINESLKWEKTQSLGSHAIYIGGKTCFCIEAKTRVMANKIYFPRVHSENNKIVFYSLETKRYHTSNSVESFLDFMGTKHYLDPHVWIEPSWS